jgi:hypothetical protein
MDMYAKIGQSIEIACNSNETSMFNRIKHQLEDGSEETLLSNHYVNPNYQRSEIHITRKGETYVVSISPVKRHSAGLYICEDDISQHDMNGHKTSIRLHVLGFF